MQPSRGIHLDPGMWKYFQAMKFVRVSLITLLNYAKVCFALSK